MAASSIATAIFPLLSRQNNDLPAFAATVRRGLRQTVFIGLPASVGLILVAREAVGVLFQRGEFSADDTARVAWVLLGFAPAVSRLLFVLVLPQEGFVLAFLAGHTLHGFFVLVAQFGLLFGGRVRQFGQTYLGLGDVLGQDVVNVAVLLLLLGLDLLFPSVLQNLLQLRLLL